MERSCHGDIGVLSASCHGDIGVLSASCHGDIGVWSVVVMVILVC